MLIILFAAGTSPALGQCTTRETAKLTPSDAEPSDYFGVSAATSADTAVIGAYGDDDEDLGWTDSGSAYVFVRAGAVWAQQAKLAAPDAADFDYFGYSVAADGDTAVIGAYQNDPGTTSNGGAAYVFVRWGSVWTQQARLVALDAADEDWFGFSVALSGNTAVIGAHQHDRQGKTDNGAAYVFVRAGSVWTQQARLTASDASSYDSFGRSVAVSGDTLVAGAPGVDLAVGSSAGTAYVFVRSGSTWTQQARLTATDAAAYDNFGFSAAINGDTAVIGAIYDDHAGGVNAGSAYVFVRSGTGWTEQAKLTASDAAPTDVFGRSVAVAGDTAVIGANQDDHWGGIDAGSAYVFARAGGVWAQRSKLTASDAAPSSFFGSAVAVYGTTVVSGATSADQMMANDAGAAYIFSPVCSAGDFDLDGDVDAADLEVFEACATGPAITGPLGGCPLAVFDAADSDHDDDVDQSDFGAFQRCYGGEDNPADPNCEN